MKQIGGIAFAWLREIARAVRVLIEALELGRVAEMDYVEQRGRRQS